MTEIYKTQATFQKRNKPHRLKACINIFNMYHVKYFEYFYMVVMVIYMAQMTNDTGRMVGTLSGNPLPFLLPIILTVILLSRHKIKWDCKQLWIIIGIFVIWSFLILAKYNAFTNTEELSYLFFLFYAIIIAYVHVRIYKKTLFPIYEHIFVWACKIAVIFWLLNVILYHSSGIVSIFPDSLLGHSILYLYQWITPAKNVYENVILRNSGCSWEPGRFAIMIVLAIYVNLSRNGIKFKNNKEIFWLLIALITTQSTTGYSTTMLLYCLFLFKKLSFRSIVIFVLIFLPLTVFVNQLDFMGEKISTQLDLEEESYQMQKSSDYVVNTLKQGEYAYSLNRFQSMYFEYDNLIHDYLLGYSRKTEHSYFYKNVSSNTVLTGGLVKIFAQYGILLGLFIYYLLFQSSVRISADFKVKRKYALITIILLNSVAYPMWCTPVFTAFWLYGSFAINEAKNKKHAVLKA